MVLPVIKYGHPVLRKKGEPIPEVTEDVRRLIADMFETMYAANGIGLAAQQVGEALRLTVIDVREVEDRPSTMRIAGESVALADHMPITLINPEIVPLSDPVSGPEGCLSFPELYGDISRPESVRVTARDEQWKTIEFECGGLLAKAVQHENDHLNGILFIDRMDRTTKDQLRPELEELRVATQRELRKGAA